MIRNKFTTRFISVFLIFIFLFNLALPSISWALTSGPTAPEATSFEPVDTTDMVNLATGDFVYNTPLLEVPGPAGGYPLSLSYHAGVMPGEEASWVGLGWTLNPGAINRTVNGFADDFNDVNNVNRFYWEGGETHTVRLGGTLGIAGIAGLSATMSIAHDTYQGFGLGSSVGAVLGLKVTEDTSVGTSAEIGVNPHGGAYASAQIGVQIHRLSLGVSATTNFKSAEITGMASVNLFSSSYDDKKPDDPMFEPGKYSAGGLSSNVSISTGKNGGAQLTLPLKSQINNHKMEKVTIHSDGFTLPIPFVHLGYNYQRYFIDETQNSSTFGAIYNPQQATSDFDEKSFDTYHLIDGSVDFKDAMNTDKTSGGSLLSYDRYSVLGQGIAGEIKPYHFKSHTFIQNRKNDNDYIVKQYTYPSSNFLPQKPVEFRFVGDFSNRYDNRNGGGWGYGSPIAPGSPPLHTSLGNQEKTGEEGTNSSGISNGHLIGSKHVEWYTNDQLLGLNTQKRPFVDGLIETNSKGFVRQTGGSLGDQIGAFKITNESGVTYHYALPVMSFAEYQRSENIDDTDGEKFSEFVSENKYAYTWLLTAVTGPDFVDRSPTGVPNGKLDEFDFGYWVEFSYGKWTSFYPWRNPQFGTIEDLDANFDNFSEGIKEVYYLNSISTKSHTAYFVKEMRHDAKSSVNFLKDWILGKTTINELAKKGGSIPKQTNALRVNGPFIPCVLPYYTRPTSSLRLKSILLFKNSMIDKSVVENSFSNGSQYQQSFQYASTCSGFSATFEHHLPQNVYDIYDLEAVNRKSDAVRVIEFDHDYSLSKKTPNSFDFTPLKNSNPPTDDNSYPKQGKLTLKGLSILGKSATNILPPIKFIYDLEKPREGHSLFSKSSGQWKFSNSLGLKIGDLVKVNNQYTAVVTDVSNTICTVFFSDGEPLNSGYYNWLETKNPDYCRECYDHWGIYKPDYINTGNSNFDRIVTVASAPTQDVWSLRSIHTPTGAVMRVQYESDEYDFVLKKLSNILVSNVQPVNSATGSIKISFRNQYNAVLENHFSVNQNVKLKVMLRHWGLIHFSYGYACDGNLQGNAAKWESIDSYVKVKEIHPNYIIAESPEAYQKITTIFGVKRYNINYASFTDNQNFPNYNFNQVPDFVGGVIVSPSKVNNKGGGMRVKSIESSFDGKAMSVHYEYLNGATSYEPLHIELPFDRLNPSLNSCLRSIESKIYNTYANTYFDELYGDFKSLLFASRELPPPGVVYGLVRSYASLEGVRQETYSEMKYNTFSDKSVGFRYVDGSVYAAGGNYDGLSYSTVRGRIVEIVDASSMIGIPLESTTMLEDGTVLTRTNYQYLSQGIVSSSASDFFNLYRNKLSSDFNAQGIIDEVFIGARFVKSESGTIDLLGLVTRKTYLPKVSVGYETYDYKTGIKFSTTNLSYDYYSGNVVKSLSADGYGNNYITETKPAYRNPAYTGGMGSAASGGKNMLTQENEAYVYKVSASNPNNKIGLVSASVKTWSNTTPVLGVSGGQPTVWRASGNYSFKGNENLQINTDGTYPMGGFSGFSNSDGWQLQSQITLYDVNSHALEAHDSEQVYASTKMDLNNAFVYSSATNAEYREQAYTGAEEAPVQSSFGIPVFGGGVYCIGGRSDNEAHTGTYSVYQAPGQPAIKYFLVPKEKTYRMSVWSTANQVTFKYRIDNQPTILTAATSKIGSAGGDDEWGWKLFQADLPVVGSNDNLEVWCEPVGQHAYFDDFRFHPLQASMTSYVYNSWGELTHVLDNNNLFTKYQYDAMGRLEATYKETLHPEYGVQGIAKVSEYKYNYGRNSPRTLAISAFKTGLTGSVSPAGNQNVPYLSSFTIRVQETCVQPKLLKVKIDGNMFIGGNGTYPLVDGTILEVSGQNYTFKNIQSPHSLIAEFSNVPPTSNGFAYCYATTDGEGNTCYTGSYGYALTNECGETGQHVIVSSISQIPSSINVSDLPLNCCSLNQPPSGGQLSLLCGCN
jgi:RHS Repeat